MHSFAAFVLLSTVCVGIASRDGGVCNVRECGCPPYSHAWCTQRNARVHSHVCQISTMYCEFVCGEDWCQDGPKPPAPAPSPHPPPPKMKVWCLPFWTHNHPSSQYVYIITQVYHHGNETDNLCYQTNYTDPNYQSKGYVPGFCPFQLVDSVEVDTICNGHSEENLKYCPDSMINITIYKMGKSL